jgi:hypothetical protein
MAGAKDRAARERKQKMFVAAGGVVLLLLVGLQLPGLLGGSSPSAAGETTSVDTTAGASTTGTPTPTPTATPLPVSLNDTDPAFAATPGKLRSFSSFARKDPFVQQVDPSATPAAEQAGEQAGASSGSSSGDGTTGTPKNASKGFTVGGATAAAATVISVNGSRQALEPGTAFPAADPVFVLVDELPGSKTVVIGVAGGAFASGAGTAKLKVGKPLVLVNTSTGARYRLVLVAVGDGSTPTTAESQSAPSKP